MIKEKNVSICAMLMKQVNEVGTILGENGSATCGLYQSKDFIVSLLQYKGSASVSDKLFSKDFFKDNKFQTGVLNEDFIFMVESLVTKDVSIYVSDYVGYNYLKRQGSTTTSGFNKTIVDLIYNAARAEEIIMDTYPDLKLEIKRFILFQIRTFMLLIPKEKMNDDFEPYVFTMNLFAKNKKYLFSANIDIVSKIFLMMLNISPSLAKTALNFLQKNIFKDRIQS